MTFKQYTKKTLISGIFGAFGTNGAKKLDIFEKLRVMLYFFNS